MVGPPSFSSIGAAGQPRCVQDFDFEGLSGFGPEQFDQVQGIDLEEWRREVLSQDELFMKIYSYLPKEMIFQRELLVARL